MMQRQWGPGQTEGYRQQPTARFSEDEISAFIEEVAVARDREAFNRLTARFDGQFIAKYKARFPNQTGKFPFGSAGKPYTYGTGPAVQPSFPPQPPFTSQPSFPPQTTFPLQAGYQSQPSFPSQPGYHSQGGFPSQQGYPAQGGYPGSYDRPQSAAMGRTGDGFGFPQYQEQGGYGAMQYQVRTPSPGKMVAGPSQRFEPTYSAPMYERAPDMRPPSYPGYSERPLEPQMSQSSRFQDYSQPYNRQPSPSKAAPSSIGDYAELRKMKEEMLARFQVAPAGQRPPRA